MTVLDVFLAEGPFPPKAGGGKKPPIPGGGQPAAAGGPPAKKPFQPKKVSSQNGNDEGDIDNLAASSEMGAAGPGAADAGNSDALIAMQNAQKEKEQQEAMAKAAKDAILGVKK